MPRVVLALIYNHRYEANVPRLDALYADQFDAVVHIMPFSDSQLDNVISVYDSSYRFGNYVAQAATRLERLDADYVVFAGDDLVLSPALTSDSIVQRLGLSDGTGFIKYWKSLADTSWWWYHIHRGYAPFKDRHSGVEWQSQLPSYAEAAMRLARHGWEDKHLTFRNFAVGPPVLRSRRAATRALGQLARGRGEVILDYPLAMGYADLFVIPRPHLREVAHFAGVLSSLGVFAEVAVPTALLLGLPSLSTSETSGGDGIEYWTESALEEFEERNGKSIPRLREAMVEEDVLWHHPVKLSRWSDS